MTAVRARTAAAPAAVTAAAGPAAWLRSAARIAAVLSARLTAPGALERGVDLRGGQLRGRGRVGGLGQQLQRVGGVQVLERLQRGGEEIPQLVAQPLDVAGPFPDQRLMRPGHDLDRLRARAVRGHRPQLMGVGAHHVRQQVRVAGVAFGLPTPRAVPGTGPPAAG